MAASTMSSMRTSTVHWPIVIHTTEGSPTDVEVDAFIRAAEQILSRRERHAVIFDSSRATSATAYMRRRSAEWLRENEATLKEYCVGTALVFSSAAMRFVMSTAMLIQPPATPYQVCGTLDEALRWARMQIALAGH